jgi:hypothetical protein
VRSARLGRFCGTGRRKCGTETPLMLSTFVWLRHLSSTESRSLRIFVPVEREAETGEKRQHPFSLIPLKLAARVD